MNKLYSLIIIPIFWLAPTIDCQTEFNCKPSTGVRDKYSLELELTEGVSEDYTFELFNLNDGSLVNKKNAFFKKGERKVIFENVKPSTYSISYSSKSCSSKKSIKGKGIVLQ